MRATSILAVHVVPKRRPVDVDHIVFSVCCALAGFLLGALFEQSQRPAPTKCAAVLEDGRHLRVKNLTADGSETHCLYEAERKRK